MEPNKIIGKPIGVFLKENNYSPETETIRAFLRFLKRKTQFRYEFIYNKQNPLLTVIPENAFNIYFAVFVEGEKEWSEINKIQPVLNQNELFPMQ